MSKRKERAKAKAEAKRLRKQKRKLTPEEKARKELYQTIFVHGKQKRIRREPMIDGMPVEEYIAQNADPIFLKQHGYYELLDEQYAEGGRHYFTSSVQDNSEQNCSEVDDEPPF